MPTPDNDDPVGRDEPHPVERLHAIARDALARRHQAVADCEFEVARILFGFMKLEEKLRRAFGGHRLLVERSCVKLMIAML